jgi:ABC-type anion transport system duplicated permease subunit
LALTSVLAAFIIIIASENFCLNKQKVKIDCLGACLRVPAPTHTHVHLLMTFLFVTLVIIMLKSQKKKEKKSSKSHCFVVVVVARLLMTDRRLIE